MCSILDKFMTTTDRKIDPTAQHIAMEYKITET